MSENLLPNSLGEKIISPVILSPEQEDFCQRLDELHIISGLSTRPSDMFRGALFVSQSFLNNNLDWVSQSANSLREIIYHLDGENFPNKEVALKEYGSAKASQPNFTLELNRVFNLLTKLAHHGRGRGSNIDVSKFSRTEFDNLIKDFERIMRELLVRQMDIHKEIDLITSFNPEE